MNEQPPSYTEFVERLVALEDQLSGELPLEAFPLKDLRSALIENGEPLDLSVLSLIGQVADFGQAGVKVRFGSSNYAWPGAVAVGAVQAFAHGLSGAPRSVVPACAFQNGVTDFTLHVDPALSTATQFSVFGRAPAAVPVGAYPFYWLAIG